MIIRLKCSCMGMMITMIYDILLMLLDLIILTMNRILRIIFQIWIKVTLDNLFMLFFSSICCSLILFNKLLKSISFHWLWKNIIHTTFFAFLPCFYIKHQLNRMTLPKVTSAEIPHIKCLSWLNSLYCSSQFLISFVASYPPISGIMISISISSNRYLFKG